MAPVMLPPVPLDMILPIVALPDTLTVLADITLAPVMLPPVPFDVRLANEALPDTLSVPETFAPVPVTVNVVLPADVIVTLPFAVAMLTLLFPLLIPDELTDINDNPPEPFVLNT